MSLFDFALRKERRGKERKGRGGRALAHSRDALMFFDTRNVGVGFGDHLSSREMYGNEPSR